MANKHLSAGDETLRRLLAGVGSDDEESASTSVSGLVSPISASEARNGAVAGAKPAAVVALAAAWAAKEKRIEVRSV